MPALSEIRYESAGGYWNQPVRILRGAVPIEGIDKVRYVRQVLLDPNFDPEGAILANRRDGGYAGFALAIATPGSTAGFITLLAVLPKYRREGMGAGLLERAEAYLRSRGCTQVTISTYPHGYFTPGVDVAAYAEGLDFLLKRGYREVMRPLAMERSLWDYDVPEWVLDISKANRAKGENQVLFESERFIPAFSYELCRFVRERFSPDWERIVREALHDILNGDSGSRLRIAMHLFGSENRIVGFAHHKAERFGPIGVDPEFRGRGIGHVLTHATLKAQQEAGYRTSWFMWSDDRTAERIYKPAGFREVRRFAILRKELAPMEG